MTHPSMPFQEQCDNKIHYPALGELLRSSSSVLHVLYAGVNDLFHSADDWGSVSAGCSQQSLASSPLNGYEAGVPSQARRGSYQA